MFFDCTLLQKKDVKDVGRSTQNEVNWRKVLLLFWRLKSSTSDRWNGVALITWLNKCVLTGARTSVCWRRQWTTSQLRSGCICEVSLLTTSFRGKSQENVKKKEKRKKQKNTCGRSWKNTIMQSAGCRQSWECNVVQCHGPCVADANFNFWEAPTSVYPPIHPWN